VTAAPGTPPYRLVAKRAQRVPYLRAAHAVQTALGRDVEMRILPGGSGPENSAAFFQELKDLVRLDHPGFHAVIGDLAIDGRPAYLVSLREHPTLAELLNDRDFTLDERCQAMRSLAGAYAAAHSAGIVLGPVPPARIAWDADAGTAYFLHHRALEADWDSPWLQHTPLQTRPEEVTSRDDVFLWGLMAFWLLTRGQHAYGAGPEDLRPLRGLERQVSARLSMVVEASLAWDPALRPEAGPELRAVLMEDRANVAVDGPPVAASVDIRAVSGEILSRVSHLRSSGQIMLRPTREEPAPENASADAALRQDDALVGEVISLKDWKPAAERHGLALTPPEPEAGSWWGKLAGLALVALLAGSGAWALRRHTGAPAPAPSTAPTSGKTRLDRPGHQDVGVQEVLSYKAEILPQDFPGVFKKLQAVIVAKKLPQGKNDTRRLMGMWIRYRRDPEGASKQLQEWLAELRTDLGADGS
jgi:hypothetical protein